MNSLTVINQNPDIYAIAKLGIERSGKAENTRYRYINALVNAELAGVDLLNRESLIAYGEGLSKSVSGHLRGALVAGFKEMESQMKTNATPENVQHIQAMMWRFDELIKAIPTIKKNGDHSGYRLSAGQVENLLKLIPRDKQGKPTMRGLQQFVILGLMLKAGLRREEVARLQWNELHQTDGGYWLKLTGKGNKKREIPISYTFGETLRVWGELLAFSGCVARSMPGRGQDSDLGECITGESIRSMVRGFGKRLAAFETNEVTKRSLLNLNPHDLRRTFGRLAYESGIAIEEISKMLGHADAKTTRIYIGVTIIAGTKASDSIPFDLEI